MKILKYGKSSDRLFLNKKLGILVMCKIIEKSTTGIITDGQIRRLNEININSTKVDQLKK